MYLSWGRRDNGVLERAMARDTRYQAKTSVHVWHSQSRGVLDERGGGDKRNESLRLHFDGRRRLLEK